MRVFGNSIGAADQAVQSGRGLDRYPLPVGSPFLTRVTRSNTMQWHTPGRRPADAIAGGFESKSEGGLGTYICAIL
jgi:hypothetical protein